jgi:hypothetical protein
MALIAGVLALGSRLYVLANSTGEWDALLRASDAQIVAGVLSVAFLAVAVIVAMMAFAKKRDAGLAAIGLIMCAISLITFFAGPSAR